MSEDLLVRHLEDEMSAVPAAYGSLGKVRRKSHRRRLRRRVVSTGTTFVVLLAALSLVVPTLPRIASADGPGMPTRLLIDGDVEIPVTDEPIAEVENSRRTLTVYGGLPAPEPDFDASDLGIEQPLIQNEPKWGNSDPGDVPVVYVGDVDDRSVFLHTNGGISLIDRLLVWMQGSEIGPHLCVSMGDSETVGGGGFCTGPGDTPEGRSTSGAIRLNNVPAGEGLLGYYVTWFALPEGTAIVTLELDHGRRLWQKPYGEMAFFDVGDYVGPTTLTAIDATGSVLYEVGLGVHAVDDAVYGEEFNETDVEIPPPTDS